MPSYDPLPEEIEERCLEIQKTWDADTRASRKTGIPQRQRPRGWMPPIISTEAFKAAIQENAEESQGSYFNEE